ncbi:putative ATP-grasp-modified RiPP [Streptomyces sp. NBC_01317]|uniref:putative ATP-grasp-modified RiPP n=1 Tax=Streptomyces sp. NBC_01317 TaxID=2903822 RepID=UPI002E1353BB|nr:putative ATP-grasp-modified RiPP [Streptomyces sp. NBC_01317]
MIDESAAPWGLTRMRPFPAGPRDAPATVVLDPVTQTGVWCDDDGSMVPVTLMSKHKRSETSSETKPRTSLDGTPDEGSDQSGDSD